MGICQTGAAIRISAREKVDNSKATSQDVNTIAESASKSNYGGGCHSPIRKEKIISRFGGKLETLPILPKSQMVCHSAKCGESQLFHRGNSVSETKDQLNLMTSKKRLAKESLFPVTIPSNDGMIYSKSLSSKLSLEKRRRGPSRTEPISLPKIREGNGTRFVNAFGGPNGLRIANAPASRIKGPNLLIQARRKFTFPELLRGSSAQLQPPRKFTDFELVEGNAIANLQEPSEEDNWESAYQFPIIVQA